MKMNKLYTPNKEELKQIFDDIIAELKKDKVF